MKVKDVMTSRARSSQKQTSLKEVAQIMKDDDFGVLPVVDDQNKVIGMITDRDISLTLAGLDSKPSQVTVDRAMSTKHYSVSPEDDVKKALDVMKEHRVRRLPVVDKEQHLQGVLSINDLILESHSSKESKEEPVYDHVMETFKSICEHTHVAAV